MKTQLKENEELVLTVRKHWFVLLRPILGTLVLLTIAVAAAFFGSDTEFADFLLYGAGITILLSLLWLTYRIFDRNNNLWAVSNFRVIDEYGVFTNNSKETPLDKINNISYRQPLLGRVFNYGSVQIQSAAEYGSTIHTMVARPKVLKDTVTRCQEQYRQWQFKEQAQNVAHAVGKQTSSARNTISEEISKLHDLKEKGIITEEEFQRMKSKLLNDWQLQP